MELIVGRVEGSEAIQPAMVDSDGRLVVGHGPSLTVAIAYSGTLAEYVGEAAPGSAQGSLLWRIKKVTYDGNDNPTDVKWADGVMTFTKEWDERAGYSYS